MELSGVVIGELSGSTSTQALFPSTNLMSGGEPLCCSPGFSRAKQSPEKIYASEQSKRVSAFKLMSVLPRI